MEGYHRAGMGMDRMNGVEVVWYERREHTGIGIVWYHIVDTA